MEQFERAMVGSPASSRDRNLRRMDRVKSNPTAKDAKDAKGIHVRIPLACFASFAVNCFSVASRDAWSP
jgi:hypothetical protein